LLGGAYLVFLGVQLWRSSDVIGPINPSAPGDEHTTALIRGMLTNLGNPKSVVYFGSIFTIFMAPGTPLWVHTAAIGIVLTNTVLWYGAVAWLFSSARIQTLYRSVQRMFNRAAGALMAGFGARLLLVKD
jgi:threonine efflux protein